MFNWTKKLGGTGKQQQKKREEKPISRNLRGKKADMPKKVKIKAIYAE